MKFPQISTRESLPNNIFWNYFYPRATNTFNQIHRLDWVNWIFIPNAQQTFSWKIRSVSSDDVDADFLREKPQENLRFLTRHWAWKGKRWIYDEWSWCDFQNRLKIHWSTWNLNEAIRDAWEILSHTFLPTHENSLSFILRRSSRTHQVPSSAIHLF